MYIRIDSDTLKKAEDITGTDYDTFAGMLPADSIEPMIKDLIYEVHRLEEKVKDMEQDIENNYEVKNVDPYLEYGVSERDFY